MGWAFEFGRLVRSLFRATQLWSGEGYEMIGEIAGLGLDGRGVEMDI